MSSTSNFSAEPNLTGYMLAASVLDTFDPKSLIPIVIDNGVRGTLEDVITKAVVDQTPERGIEWRLPDSERRKGLVSLQSAKNILAAIEKNSRAKTHQTVNQRIFEDCLRGSVRELNSLSFEELLAVAQSRRLLVGIVEALPDEDSILEIVKQKEILEPFQCLADRYFQGREEELHVLEDFLGAVPTESFMQHVKRYAMGLFSSLQKSPLLIVGPGGIGKSALIAKFLLTRSQIGRNQFVFAYVDLDRRSVVVEQPRTILLEFVSQLGAQFPNRTSRLAILHKRMANELGRQGSLEQSYLSQSTLSGGELQAELTDDIKELQSGLGDLSISPEAKWLVVLDTFEEATQREGQLAANIFHFLELLQKTLPQLRVVILSRSPLPEELKHFVLKLEGLPEKEAKAFLDQQQVSDQEVVNIILKLFGGHPLSLRLAAQLYNTVRMVRGVSGARKEFDSPMEKLSEPLLLRRYIHHIDNLEVRKVAYPGFALREITPELILEVLREPCDLKVKSIADATALFNELARNNSLVQQLADTVIRHRPEVRELTLRHLMATDRESCELIWENAIKYYQAKEGVKNRANEIYARIMLGRSIQEIQGRWVPGAERYLRSAKGDFSTSYLGLFDWAKDVRIDRAGNSRANLRTDGPSVLGDKVANFSVDLKRMLSSGRAAEIIAQYGDTLETQSFTSRRILLPILIRAHAQIGDRLRAWELVSQALDELGDSKSDRSVLLEVLITRSQLATTILLEQQSLPELIVPREEYARIEYLIKNSEADYKVLRLGVETQALYETILFGAEGFTNITKDWNSEEFRPVLALALLTYRIFLKVRKSESLNVEDPLLVLRLFACVACVSPQQSVVLDILTIEDVYWLLRDKYLEKMVSEGDAVTKSSSTEDRAIAKLLLRLPVHETNLKPQFVNAKFTNQEILGFAFQLKKSILRESGTIINRTL